MTGEPEVRIVEDPDAASRAAAAVIADALRAGVAMRGRADWATTGGSTPVGIYRALAAPAVRDGVPWASVHAWWGDDRYAARGDALSNVRPFDEAFVPQIPIPPANVHAPPMADAIERGAGVASAAKAYAEELEAAGLPVAALPEGGGAFPVLDVVLAGIGSDGHVLSVFPGSGLFASAAWVSPVDAPTHIEPHVARISLHPSILRLARLPLVVAHGAGKAAILADVLCPERDESRWPAQVARRPGALWILDRAAAADLGR